ncbi:hypothetical protein LINPERPRIM_LOCUS724, partial [Linum perenne]
MLVDSRAEQAAPIRVPRKHATLRGKSLETVQSIGSTVLM